MPASGAVVLARLVVILSSSLAQDSHSRGFWEGLGVLKRGTGDAAADSSVNHGVNHPGDSSNISSSPLSTESLVSHSSNHSSTCHDPCATLHHSVTPAVALAPFGIALLFVLAGALPVLLFRSRHRVLGVRSCLWVLADLWVQLALTCVWFGHDRAQAYVWALHACSHALASWQPRRGVVPFPGLQRFVCLAGAWGVGLFAWQLGPPVGLAAWYRSGDALCGWKVHLTAVLGLEAVGWVLGPVEGVVAGFGY